MIPAYLYAFAEATLAATERSVGSRRFTDDRDVAPDPITRRFARARVVLGSRSPDAPSGIGGRSVVPTHGRAA